MTEAGYELVETHDLVRGYWYTVWTPAKDG
jgi:hypothetical protein